MTISTAFSMVMITAPVLPTRTRPTLTETELATFATSRIAVMGYLKATSNARGKTVNIHLIVSIVCVLRDIFPIQRIRDSVSPMLTVGIWYWIRAKNANSADIVTTVSAQKGMVRTRITQGSANPYTSAAMVYWNRVRSAKKGLKIV
jgi:hypothetical protein